MSNPTANHRGRMVVRLPFGLANRLSGLLSAIVVAEKFGLKLEIVWERDPEVCDALFADLFETQGVEDVRFWEKFPGAPEWLHFQKLTPEILTQTQQAGETLYVDAFKLFGDTLVGTFEFYERLRAKLKTLRPVPAVLELVNSVPVASVGIHVRMTDHIPSRVITPRWCYRESLAWILTAKPDGAVYICTDTPGLARELVASNPRRVFAMDEARRATGLARSSISSLRIALAEIWILSRCTVVIGTPPSTFALLASVFSGAVFLRLAAWPLPLTWRLEKLLWPLYRAARYDLQRHRWGLQFKRGAWFVPVSALALVAIWILCSPLYQDWALPFHRRRLRKQLTRALGRE